MPSISTAATTAPVICLKTRYKSILCDEENYLIALVRYCIHLTTPVRAQIVKTIEELDRYPWSGHGTIIGTTNHPWMDVDSVLSQFGGRKKSDIRIPAVCHGRAGSGASGPELTGGGLIRSQGGWSRVLALRRAGRKEESDERILGSGDFVHAIIRETEERQLRQTKLRRSRKGIGDIIREECGERQGERRGIGAGSRRRKVSETRAVIACRCKQELGISGAEIARHLGVNTTSINRAVEKADGLPGRR